MKKFTAFILSLLFLIPNLNAADGSKEVFVLDDFSGGLASKISPYGLPAKFATLAENVRFNSKYHSFSRRDNLNVYGVADDTEPITGMFRHYLKNGNKVLLATHGNELEKGDDDAGTFTSILSYAVGDHRWQFVTWHNIAIGTDGYNQPIKYDGSSASATYLGSLLATLDAAGSGPVTGAYTYKVSCYSSTYEILLNTASNTIAANGNDVLLSMIPICPDTTLNGEATTGRNIYRTETGGSTYKLLSNGAVANNTAVTLTDSDADGALGATMPAGDATWAPPKARFLIVHDNRLFFANDPTNNPSRVWYTEDGSHEVVASDSYLDIRQDDGDTITFLKDVLGILTVGKDNTIQKIYTDGGDPVVDWRISDPLSFVGSQAPYSTVNTPLGLLYLNRAGIYRFNGQSSELISESVSTVIADISPTNLANTWGVYHDNIYYLAYNSKTSASSTNDRVLVLDILAKAYSIDLIGINAFATFNSGNDWGTLYSGSSTDGSVYAFSDSVDSIIHSRSSDFAGLWDDMRYIPTAVGGDAASPILEIARTESINEMSGTINNLVGIIDRQDVLGHYTSQPLTINANALDKIYWNENIPGTGGDVSFQVRTSPTGESNLLLNDDMEFWDNWGTGTPLIEQPNDWTYTQSGTGGSADQSTTEVKRGTYSAKITKSNSGQSQITITIPNATSYRNKTLAVSAYTKSANSVSAKVRIQITDGSTTGTANYANGGGWEKLSTTLAVSGAATTITVKCIVETGADAVAYFDQIMARQASTTTNDWSAWSTPVTDSSGSDISSAASNTYLQYLITMSTDNIIYTPTINRVGQYDIRLTYTREGTPQSTVVPVHYRTGFLDFGTPNRRKSIRAIEAYHTGEDQAYTITLTAFESNSGGTYTSTTDIFDVNTGTFPTKYKARTTGGALSGELFQVDISNQDGVEPFSFDKLVITYDTEAFV